MDKNIESEAERTYLYIKYPMIQPSWATRRKKRLVIVTQLTGVSTGGHFTSYTRQPAINYLLAVNADHYLTYFNHMCSSFTVMLTNRLRKDKNSTDNQCWICWIQVLKDQGQDLRSKGKDL